VHPRRRHGIFGDTWPAEVETAVTSRFRQHLSSQQGGRARRAPVDVRSRCAIIVVMKPSGVHHVSINVDDVQAALAFYVDVLGLEVRSDRPDFNFRGAWLNAGGQQVHLIQGPPPEDRGQHFALAFVDVSAVVAELRREGLKVTDPVVSGTSLQSFTTDPAGNRVELHQPGAISA
jgi:glyoxylase I family protein